MDLLGPGKGGGCRWCAVCRCLLAALLFRRRRCSCGRTIVGLLPWLVAVGGVGVLIKKLCDCLRRSGPVGPVSRGPVVQRVPARIYRRPDPLIYSQRWLQAQGLAVTWDNPDIHIERAGVRVAPHSLDPATEYEIVAQIWNGSTLAPAVAMPVRFSYLGFGVATGNHPIGSQHVDLPVKGAPGLPAIARMPWTTPSAPGHYCIQVELIWPDDLNPYNNLGQTNTDVKPLNSPRATFLIPVRNEHSRTETFQLEVDSYRLAPQLPCPPSDPHGAAPDTRARELRREQARSRHLAGGHPIPDGWDVALAPRELQLEPGQETEVRLEVQAPDGFSGAQTFNLNVLANGQLVGGVTLTAEGKA